MNAAIFDMDGLLVASEILYVDAFKEVSDILGYKHSDELFKSCIGTNKKTQEMIIKAHYGEDYPFEECYKLTHQVVDTYISEGKLHLQKGVIEILDMFKAKGFKLAVASSNDYSRVMKSLNITNITHYFDEIITGDMVTHGKPDPEIFLLACQKIGSTPKETYVFEDSYNGVRAGHAGGFYTIMVPDILPETPEMVEKAELVLNNLLSFC